jgi:hypothetical protein
MDSAPSLDEFRKMQIPALRHDADRLEAWRQGRGSDEEVYAIADRLIRLHDTISQQDWLDTDENVERGLGVLRTRLDDDVPAGHIALLTNLLVAKTRAMLGDDPGPEPHGGPLAAEMALGSTKKV